MSEQKDQLSSVTTIKDPNMDPYFIGRDSYCYTVYENVESSESPGKTYLKSLGHYTNLESCLKSIALLKINKKKQYDTLKEYIFEWNKTLQSFSQTINPEI
jgi:hypothetical protein